MLLTTMVNNSVRLARDRGVYVVVFTTPYINNRNTPPDQVKPNENDWMPEDVATLVVDTHIPWEHGLVHVPQIPEMAVCPGSSIGGCAIHWMISAEVAQALATDTPPEGSCGRRYLDILLAHYNDHEPVCILVIPDTSDSMHPHMDPTKNLLSLAFGFFQSLALLSSLMSFAILPTGQVGDYLDIH